MKTRQAQMLAAKLATEIMTPGGSKERAKEMKLHDGDGRYLGGWSYVALAEFIASMLKEDVPKPGNGLYSRDCE